MNSKWKPSYKDILILNLEIGELSGIYEMMCDRSQQENFII